MCLKVILKITMTSPVGVEIRKGEGSLGTCPVGLVQLRRPIMADKGEIRRFKIGKVVCGHCTSRLRGTGGRGSRVNVDKMSIHKKNKKNPTKLLA